MSKKKEGPEEPKDKTKDKAKDEPKKASEYGVYKADTDRYGWCWCYRVRVLEDDGKIHMRAASGFKSKGEAEAAVAQLRLDARARRHGIQVGKPLIVPTVGECIDSYIHHKESQWESDQGAEYLHRNKGQLNPLRIWSDLVGRERPVNSITRDDMGAYVLSETRRGISKSSIARRINSIYAALNHARDTKVEALASYRAPKRPLGKDASVGRMRILTPAEIKTLTTALAADERLRDMLDFFLVALGAGGRFDEIVPTVVRKETTSGIMWERIDTERHTIQLYSYKTKKWRTILVPAVVELLIDLLQK